MSEQAYQDSFIHAILARSEALSAGDKIYRNNWAENAHRALKVSFPTVFALLGESNFRAIAKQACMDIPKVQYDWGEWAINGEFADTISKVLVQQDAFHTLDYVVDCAHLDAAAFQCQRAQDPITDNASFSILSSEDAESAELIVANNLQIVTSIFPLHTLYEFVHSQVGTSEALVQALADARRIKQAHTFVVYRKHFKPLIESYDKQQIQLLECAREGHTIASLFDTAAELQIDFSSWLGTAISNQLIVAAKQ